MDGISEEFSAYPMTLESATGGAEWGPWFDRLVGAWAQYRIIEQNDPTASEGRPNYSQPAQVNVSGSINATTLLMLGGAALVLYLMVRK